MEEKAAQVAILNLMNLCSLMVICLLTASMSQFLDKCFQKGMIFRKYYNLICYWLWLPKKTNKAYIKWIARYSVRQKQNISVFYRPIFTINKYQWLFKVLGGCIYCFSTWIYIITFLIIGKIVFPYNFFILAVIGVFGIGLNYFFIEVIQKIKA